jgi:Kef-type K+ transport system membrane component KefB
LLALSLSKQIVDGSISIVVVMVPIIKAVLFLVAGIYIGHKYLSRFIEHLDKTLISQKYPEFVFIFVMMIAFLYAMAAEVLGLSSIVGAFIAGISLEGVAIRHGKNYKQGADYLHIIFASIFFVSLGILVDTHVLTLKVFWFLVVLTIVAILTKVVGFFLPAKWQGLSFKDSAIIGFGMSPRGEVAMIVGLIGLNQNLITQEIYAAIIFMSLMTTIVTPIVLRNWLYQEKS